MADGSLLRSGGETWGQCGPTMLRKQVSGPLDSLDPRSWPPRRAGRGNSKKDLVTGPFRGFCALQDKGHTYP
jgi:hypothetical protein